MKGKIKKRIFDRFHEDDCIRSSHFCVNSSANDLLIVFIDRRRCVSIWMKTIKIGISVEMSD